MDAPLREAPLEPNRTRALSAEAVRRLPAGEAFQVEVAGTSMEPTLVAGDSCHALRGQDALLGDLVVVDLPGAGLVVHRLLWRGRAGMRTRGDGSGLMDPPLQRGALLGRVVRVDRSGREVTPSAARRRVGWLVHFAAACRHRLARRLGVASAGGGPAT